MVSLALSFMLGRLKTAFAWITANPLLALCAGLAIFGLWERHEATRWHNVANGYRTALEATQRLASANKAKGQAIAKDNANEHKTTLARDLSIAGRYVASHRVQQCPSGVGVEGADTSVPIDAPALPVMVAVRDTDIAACTIAHDQALGGARFLQSLVDGGLGEVVK